MCSVTYLGGHFHGVCVEFDGGHLFDGVCYVSSESGVGLGVI